MENVTDALRMASAALLFVIAFTVTMVMFSQARQSTDSVVGHLNAKEYLPKIDSLDTNITREVGIETVIPTLYRYAQSDENIQIRIVDPRKASQTADNSGEVQIFDTNIESQMRNKTYGTTSSSVGYNTAYIDELYNKYDNPSRPAYLFGAPWYSQGYSYILERINAYIYGEKMEHCDSVDYNASNLKAYFNNKFYESYLEYRTSGEVYVDELGEEIVKIPAGTKIIITYTVK